MDLDPARLRTAFPEREIRCFDQVDSTQDIALDWVASGGQHGCAVVADEQLKGRGRQGRFWHTPPGVALAVSVLLKPARDGLPQVTMLGALAIVEMVESLGIDDVGIKWPNDVLVAGRKVSGVLPEASWDGDTLTGVALGMGVNVRVDFSGSDLSQSAVSIEPLAGHSVNRTDLIVTLLERIDYWSQYLGTFVLFNAWRDRLLTIGQAVTIQGVDGLAESVTRDGALVIRDDDGQAHTVYAGEIELR